MDTAVSRTMRLSLTAAVVAFLAGCGGDANEEGAATPDTTGQAAVSAAPGDVANASAVSPQEAVAFMATADQSEVQAAQVAVGKATDREVRQFAQKMRTEHSKSAQDNAELAKRLNVTLDTTAQAGPMVASLKQMSQQMSQQLTSTPKGPQFDRTYIDGQVQAHQTVLENLQRIAGTSGTPGAAGATGAAAPAAGGTTQPATPQEAAQKMIPHVQQHLDEAKRIQTRLQGAGR